MIIWQGSVMIYFCDVTAPTKARKRKVNRDPIEVSIRLHLTKHQAWELLWRPECQRRWLGMQSCIDLQKGCRMNFVDHSGLWRAGIIQLIKDCGDGHYLASFKVFMAPEWREEGHTSLLIYVDEMILAKPLTLVTIKEYRVPTNRVSSVQDYWDRRGQLLLDLDEYLIKRRDSPRQAVVLIHGIGEQQPGETLKGFLGSGVLGKNESDAFIKPDRVSDSFELRMASVKSNSVRPITDVYEFYWAHKIQDTTSRHLFGWLKSLIFRWPLKKKMNHSGNSSGLFDLNVPRPLLPLWLVSWGLMAIAGCMIFVFYTIKFRPAFTLQFPSLSILIPASLFLGLIWRYFVKSLALDYLGDAARYLRPYPKNIAHRQEIRSEGVRQLERLHKSGKYDRIVVVGHSLGSVIAYDILTYLWIDFHHLHRYPATRRGSSGIGPFQKLRAVEKAAGYKIRDKQEAQSLQHEAWRSMRVNTQPWLVTDLVTLGSPLTYSSFLLADDLASFQKLKRNRSLPICPPWMEEVKPLGKVRKNLGQRFSFEQSYTSQLGGKPYTFSYFHHAALFGVTRWTNIYIPSSWGGLSGDLVSGPLGNNGCFGEWVMDLQLEKEPLKIMHTWYMDKEKGLTHNREKRIEALKSSLKLDSKKEIITLLHEMPVYMFFD
jgi:hypothetical protein